MKPTYLLIPVFLFLFALLLQCQVSDPVRSDQSLDAILSTYNLEASDLHILIDKSDYRLSIMSDTFTVKQYPVVFGKNPVEDKRMEGDRCTPEGEFHMRTKYPHRSWRKFIWINYPTADSWEKHRAAKEAGLIPANASIGGEIGIHGVPEGYDFAIDNRDNWTLGCISMKNSDVDEVYGIITSDMLIIIRK